jgi:hypothetical protein
MDLIGYSLIGITGATAIFQIIIDVISEIKQISCCTRDK